MDRLDKVIAETTEFSRKEVRTLLREGRIEIDGVKAPSVSFKVQENSVITIDGEEVPRKRRIVAILNKPKGYVCSVSDPRDRTVMELVPKSWMVQKVFPVGRLDKDTEGLLVFSNDGDFAHRLISPRSGIEKEYYVEHQGCAGEDDVRAFREGITLSDGEKCRPAVLIPLGDNRSRVIVTEGKYHEVRRLMASRNMGVDYLRRDRVGGLELSGLGIGEWKELDGEEEDKIFSFTKK